MSYSLIHYSDERLLLTATRQAIINIEAECEKIRCKHGHPRNRVIIVKACSVRRPIGITIGRP